MRKFVISSVIGVAIIGLASFAYLSMGRDKTTGFDVNKVSKANNGQKAAQDPGLRPVPGTYTYVGTGTESVSALGGSKHDFPSEIAVVVKLQTGCKWTMETLYAKEHTVLQTMCTDESGVRQLKSTETVSFFDIKDVSKWKCNDAYFVKAGVKNGARWTWSCNTPDTKTENFKTLVGSEQIVVGDATVTAMHYKAGDTVTGKSEGTDTNEEWMLPSGLFVHWIGHTEADSKSVIGDTHFSQKTDFTLKSVTPA